MGVRKMTVDICLVVPLELYPEYAGLLGGALRDRPLGDRPLGDGALWLFLYLPRH